jgi:integrase
MDDHKTKQEKESEKLGDSYQNYEGYVFTTETGLFIDPRNLLRAYQRALKSAGILYRKFHNLRHTYATKLFEADVPLKTVQELLGHSDITMTANIYTHVMPEKKVDAVEKLNNLFT